MKSFGFERMKNERRNGIGVREVVGAMFGPAPGTRKDLARSSSLWKMGGSPCPLPAGPPLPEMSRAAVPHSPLGRWARPTAVAFLSPCSVVEHPAKYPLLVRW